MGSDCAGKFGFCAIKKRKTAELGLAGNSFWRRRKEEGRNSGREMDCLMGSTGTLDLTAPEPPADLSGGVHLLPCTIKHDGPCAVSHYFKPRATGSYLPANRTEPVSFCWHFPCVCARVRVRLGDLEFWRCVSLPGMEADGLAVQEAYLRGRKLQGAAVPLPRGYSGNSVRCRLLDLSFCCSFSVYNCE